MGEPAQGPFSPCAQGHVAYKPRQGDMLMFYDMRPDYKMGDPFSTHTGCPVVKGVKWNAVKWIHGKPFRGVEAGNHGYGCCESGFVNPSTINLLLDSMWVVAVNDAKPFSLTSYFSPFCRG